MNAQSKHGRLVLRSCGVLLTCLALAACGGEQENEVKFGKARGVPGYGNKPKPGAAAAVAAPAEGGAAPATIVRDPIAYKDEDFVESISNRDPFKKYSTQFRADTLADGVQRRVYMPTTAVEEMRLIAIVTGVAKPKAMLLDPVGVGHVVERGDYVGRPKVIQASGNVAMTLNWRVDRIRDNEVVLTQEDATDPTRIAMTKIIPLREEGEVQ